jgi:hypothetical protein
MGKKVGFTLSELLHIILQCCCGLFQQHLRNHCTILVVSLLTLSHFVAHLYPILLNNITQPNLVQYQKMSIIIIWTYQDMMEWMSRTLDGEMAGVDEDFGLEAGQMWLNFDKGPNHKSNSA